MLPIATEKNKLTAHYAHSDWLRAGWCGDQIPVGARFSATVQTGPRAHPASCTMGTGSIPGGGQSGRGVALTTTPCSVEVKERVEGNLCSPYGPYGLYRASVPVQECTLPYLLHYAQTSKCLRCGTDTETVADVGLDMTLAHNGVKFPI